MKIVFMGTPQFAVPSLQKLIECKEHEVIAVYTMPPRPAGRGQKEAISPIHALALKHNIPVYNPRNFKDYADYEAFVNLKADVAIVAAYGVILPERILNATKHGCINIHPSKLPRWRGAAPIQHTILAGDKETSVCIMQMDKGMDTGDILLERNVEVPSHMTSTLLHNECSQIGAEMLLEALQALQAGTLMRKKQSEDGITHAHKLSRSDEKINFNQEARLVGAQIRAFSPRPGAYFNYNGETIKIIECEVDQTISTKGKPGTILDDDLHIACASGVIRPTLLQREGRKMLYTDAFLRGFKIAKGNILR
ncbi:MAG: fmt [Candidatus Midichloriaceae bacterium]|jgi:methionyl-tRNA formyltransferase|nr:fmt [Candidatus Midichloriaceae bacterium]